MKIIVTKRQGALDHSLMRTRLFAKRSDRATKKGNRETSIGRTREVSGGRFELAKQLYAVGGFFVNLWYPPEICPALKTRWFYWGWPKPFQDATPGDVPEKLTPMAPGDDG
jgi:hypothetical protein